MLILFSNPIAGTESIFIVFRWLDTLGKAAYSGVSVVTKRSFSGLFDENEIPTPVNI